MWSITTPGTIVWDQYDLVFCLPTNVGLNIRKLWNCQPHIRTVPLVVSHNSGLGRRHAVLLEAILGADYVIVNNYAMWAACQPFARPGIYNAINISNGVDRDIFHPRDGFNALRADRRQHDSPNTICRVIWTATESKAADPQDVKGYQGTLQHLKTMLDNMGHGWEPDFPIINAHNALTPDKMAEWYSGAEILVCASRSEGTPNILLEAMACGCVPVTTAVGNVTELVQHKQNGYIVSQNNLDGFHRGLEYVREHWPRMSKAALESMDGWGWSDRAVCFYRLFRRIIAGETIEPYTYLNEPNGAED